MLTSRRRPSHCFVVDGFKDTSMNQHIIALKWKKQWFVAIFSKVYLEKYCDICGSDFVNRPS